MEKIYEITYSANGIKRYAYFKGDFMQSKFYENWNDCNEQNAKVLDSFETDRIKTALSSFFKRPSH